VRPTNEQRLKMSTENKMSGIRHFDQQMSVMLISCCQFNLHTETDSTFRMFSAANFFTGQKSTNRINIFRINFIRFNIFLLIIFIPKKSYE